MNELKKLKTKNKLIFLTVFMNAEKHSTRTLHGPGDYPQDVQLSSAFLKNVFNIDRRLMLKITW